MLRTVPMELLRRLREQDLVEEELQSKTTISVFRYNCC